jgi:phosphonate transport system permease protein
VKIQDTLHRQWYKQVFVLAVIAVLLADSAYLTGANWADVFSNTDQMVLFLGKFMHPDWAYLGKIAMPLLQTLQMSVCGTVLGVVVAVPVAFIATTTVTNNVILTTIVRFILSVVRTIPNLLLASLFVAMFGIGQVTGVITLAVFTFGMVSQLIFEAIENIDHGPIEAAASVGANKVQIAFWSVLPQVFLQILCFAMYAFEINVRASTVLGYVGAGGIGIMLNSSLALFRYDRVSVIILVILLVVVLIDSLSEMMRKKLG